MKSEYIPQYFSAYHSERISYSQSGRFEAQALSLCEEECKRVHVFAPPSSPQLSQEAKKDNKKHPHIMVKRKRQIFMGKYILYLLCSSSSTFFY